MDNEFIYCPKCGEKNSTINSNCQKCSELLDNTVYQNPQTHPLYYQPQHTNPNQVPQYQPNYSPASQNKKGVTLGKGCLIGFLIIIAIIVALFFATALQAISDMSDKSNTTVLSTDYSVTEKPTNSTPNATNPSTTKIQTTVSSTKTWHKVIAFSGSSTKRTEMFNISCDEWRIKWETSPAYGYDMNFAIEVIGPNGIDGGAMVIANVLGANSDESYFYKKGSYYLEITALQNYTIVIEEYR